MARKFGTGRTAGILQPDVKTEKAMGLFLKNCDVK